MTVSGTRTVRFSLLTWDLNLREHADGQRLEFIDAQVLGSVTFNCVGENTAGFDRATV